MPWSQRCANTNGELRPRFARPSCRDESETWSTSRTINSCSVSPAVGLMAFARVVSTWLNLSHNVFSHHPRIDAQQISWNNNLINTFAIQYSKQCCSKNEAWNDNWNHSRDMFFWLGPHSNANSETHAAPNVYQLAPPKVGLVGLDVTHNMNINEMFWMKIVTCERRGLNVSVEQTYRSWRTEVRFCL